MNNTNKNNFNEEKENNFTMLRKNDTIKTKDSFLNGTVWKDTQNILNRTKEIGKEKSNAIKPPAQNNTAPVNNFIPKEKKEQERLKRATGSYDLKKSDPNEINKHLKLTQKTPDDYYSLSVPHKELNKRLDNEAFGPKTDFSVWNFENNYDKMNKEEQSMLTYKMQREFNNLGYTDSNGNKLKTDGVLGDKTNSVLEQYKKDNKDELEDQKANFKSIEENKDYSILKDSNGKPLLLASIDMTPKIKLLGNSDDKDFYPINIVTNDQQLLSELKEKGFSPGEDTLQETIKKRSDYLIKENKNNIIDAANEFGVNPGILGAIIYTEQVNNVNMLDYYFDDFGGKLGIDTSIGLAQVKISTAKMLEEEGYMPRITVSSNERKTENAKRIEALNDPQTNIRYAAAYLKYFQDKWEEFYPEIDGRTAILATLYNLGEKNTNPNSSPKPNSFGEDAKSYYYYVRELLNLKEG